MGALSGIVQALSADVVVRLAALTPAITLTFGGIQLARASVYASGSPNRIVMIPTTVEFGAKDVSSSSNVQGYPAEENKVEWVVPSVGTQYPTFLVQCWGQSNPPDPNGGDYDVCEALYQTVIVSARKLVSGSRVSATRGVFLSQKDDGSNLDVAGAVFEFGLRFDAPLLALLEAGSVVTATPKPSAFYQPPGGSPVPP